MQFSLNTEEDSCYPAPQCNRIYSGSFGGELYITKTKLRQAGTAFFVEEAGGPLAVDARGRSRKNSSGFGGVQIV